MSHLWTTVFWMIYLESPLPGFHRHLFQGTSIEDGSDAQRVEVRLRGLKWLCWSLCSWVDFLRTFPVLSSIQVGKWSLPTGRRWAQGLCCLVSWMVDGWAIWVLWRGKLMEISHTYLKLLNFSTNLAVCFEISTRWKLKIVELSLGNDWFGDITNL